jgi:hypothetical protein
MLVDRTGDSRGEYDGKVAQRRKNRRRQRNVLAMAELLFVCAQLLKLEAARANGALPRRTQGSAPRQGCSSPIHPHVRYLMRTTGRISSKSLCLVTLSGHETVCKQDQAGNVSNHSRDQSSSSTSGSDALQLQGHVGCVCVRIYCASSPDMQLRERCRASFNDTTTHLKYN